MHSIRSLQPGLLDNSGVMDLLADPRKLVHVIRRVQVVLDLQDLQEEVRSVDEGLQGHGFQTSGSVEHRRLLNVAEEAVDPLKIWDW